MDAADHGAELLNDLGWETEQFQRHRLHLEAVAYRMLGSVSEAEDALQEAWLRLSRSQQETIHNARAWLTTIVGRVCIDMLRTGQSRREDYVGGWVPEPIVEVDEQADPERQMLIADTIGLALLVVLETLTPTERVAYVLHDMFAVPFAEIGEIIDRTPDAARQLASRERRRVRGAMPQPDADLAKQREVVDAFLAASRAGDFDALIAVLDPDVVFRASGARQLQQELNGGSRHRAHHDEIRPASRDSVPSSDRQRPGRPRRQDPPRPGRSDRIHHQRRPDHHHRSDPRSRQARGPGPQTRCATA